MQERGPGAGFLVIACYFQVAVVVALSGRSGWEMDLL